MVKEVKRPIWVRHYLRSRQDSALCKYANVALVDSFVDPAVYQHCVATQPIHYMDEHWEQQVIEPGTPIRVDIKHHILRLSDRADAIHYSIRPDQYRCPEPKRVRRNRRKCA